MGDPFNESGAHLTVLRRDQIATTGPTLDGIPTDSKPFSEMAAYFGAAATILNRFQNGGRDYVSPDELYAHIKEVWLGVNGREFCDKVMGIVLQYHAGPREDSVLWDIAVITRDQLLREGYGGMGVAPIRKVARAHCADLRVDAQHDNELADKVTDMVVRHWFWNANK